jgi:ligand-binding SRPBCC domain-containing protein
VATIRIETLIQAPAALCFDLARDIEAHVQSAAHTGERAVGSPSTGLVKLGDSVTFEAKHLGFRWRLTSRIMVFDPPRVFVDQMVAGPFRHMRHTHEFEVHDGATRMTDALDFASPLGPLGRIADALVVTRHLRDFVERRAAWLKTEAERRASAGFREVGRGG